jgi:CheY-like chemotaxis protein
VPCILIVDNELFQRLLIRETLNEDLSLAFIEAADGIQALSLAQLYRPDAIILEILLPRLCGYAVYEQLHTSPDVQYIPVIFMTTRPSTRNDVQALLTSGHTVILKPFEPEALHAAVRQALNPSKLPSQVA